MFKEVLSKMIKMDFSYIVSGLKDFKINFVIVGGYAKYLNGLTDIIHDIDIFIPKYNNSLLNIGIFLSIFNSKDKANDLYAGKIVRIFTHDLIVDLLPKLDGLNEIEVFEESEIKLAYGEEVRVINMKHLQINLLTIENYLI